MTEQEIYIKFADISRKSGEEYIIPSSYAGKFIDLSEQNGFAVIGIDGLHLVNGKIIPDMNNTADFSRSKIKEWEKFRLHCNQLAKKIISEYKTKEEYGYIFCLMDKDEFLTASK